MFTVLVQPVVRNKMDFDTLEQFVGHRVCVKKLARNLFGLFATYDNYFGILRKYQASFYLEGDFGAVAITKELIVLQDPQAEEGYLRLL